MLVASRGNVKEFSEATDGLPWEKNSGVISFCGRHGESSNFWLNEIAWLPGAKGGPNYNIYVVEIVKYMTVHIAVILLFCSCFDFEDDEIPNDIVAVDTQNTKQEGGSQYGSKNGASSATNSRLEFKELTRLRLSA